MPSSAQAPEWREVLIAWAAVQTGLLAAFAEPRDPADAARELGLDARAARIVATALAGFGYLEEAGDGLPRLSARGRAMLAPAGDGIEPVGGLHLEARSIRSHLALADSLRSGLPQDDVSGGDEATRALFMRAMRHVAAPRVAASVAAVGPPPPGGRMLDVGGAPGTYARAFTEAGWDVTVLDLPGTLAVAGADLRAAGVRTVAGDATVALPEGPWEAVYLGNVLHLFPPDAAAALVARAGAALVPGGLLAIQEVLGDESPQGPGFGVMMLLSTPGGDAYPRERYVEWMAAAGCPLERSVALEGGEHHLMLGRRGAG